VPLVTNAGNKPVNVEKMQIKGVTMATSHWSPPPVTCHTDLSVENKKQKENLPEHWTFMEPRDRQEGQTGSQKQQSFLKQTTRASLCGDDSNMHVQSDHWLANRKSPS